MHRDELLKQVAKLEDQIEAMSALLNQRATENKKNAKN